MINWDTLPSVPIDINVLPVQARWGQQDAPLLQRGKEAETGHWRTPNPSLISGSDDQPSQFSWD